MTRTEVASILWTFANECDEDCVVERIIDNLHRVLQDVEDEYLQSYAIDS